MGPKEMCSTRKVTDSHGTSLLLPSLAWNYLKQFWSCVTEPSASVLSATTVLVPSMPGSLEKYCESKGLDHFQ
eukprot:13057364-Ditylum_brightwellii.AAC.1